MKWRIYQLVLLIHQRLLRMENRMATQDDVTALQVQLDQLAADLAASLAGIQGDLDALKIANPTLDLSGLTASVGALAGVVASAQAVDEQTPPV